MSQPVPNTLEYLKREILGKSDALVESTAGAEPPEQPSDEFLHAFFTGGNGYVIPAGTPAVLLQLLDIRRLPFSPAWFEGLVHHRGDLVPVFDLGRFFDPAAGPGKGRYLLVIGRQDAKAALRVEQVTAFPAGELEGESTANEDRSHFIRRRLLIAGGSFMELDLEGLFNALIRGGAVTAPPPNEQD